MRTNPNSSLLLPHNLPEMTFQGLMVKEQTVQEAEMILHYITFLQEVSVQEDTQ